LRGNDIANSRSVKRQLKRVSEEEVNRKVLNHKHFLDLLELAIWVIAVVLLVVGNVEET